MTPEGWRAVTLREVCSLQYGKGLPAEARRAGRVTVFGSNGAVGKHDQALVSGPGIIIGRKGSIGELAWSEQDFWPIDTTYWVERRLAVDLRWLFFVLGALNLRSMNTATGIPGLNREDAYGCPVLLPPLGEQRKIAAILSSVDDAIEATQAVIDQLQVVKKAMMAELLTRGLPGRHTRFKMTEIGEIPEEWEVVRLGDLATFVTSGSRAWAEFYADEGPLFIRSQYVRAGFLDLEDRVFVQPPKGAEGARTRLTSQDILVTITGNSVGNVAVAPAGLGEAYVSQHVGLIRLKQPTLASYCALYLAPGAPGNNQVVAAQYGQSKPGLNLTNLKSFQIAIPPRYELDAIESAIRGVQQRGDWEALSLGAIRAVKSALMSVLLTGEVRVKPDEGAPA